MSEKRKVVLKVEDLEDEMEMLIKFMDRRLNWHPSYLDAEETVYLKRNVERLFEKAKKDDDFFMNILEDGFEMMLDWMDDEKELSEENLRKVRNEMELLFNWLKTELF